MLSGNHNFDGRIHPTPSGRSWPPPLVVAYAIAGTVRFDIERTRAGRGGRRGNPLKDLWPSDEEIDAIVAAAVKPERSSRSTSRCSTWARRSKPESPLYDWRPMSTYIRRRRTGKGAARWRHLLKGHAPAGDAAGQHHHRPPVAVQRHFWPAPPAIPGLRKWAAGRRLFNSTPPTVATT